MEDLLISDKKNTKRIQEQHIWEAATNPRAEAGHIK